MAILNPWLPMSRPEVLAGCHAAYCLDEGSDGV